MTELIIRMQALTPEAFAPFGEVLQTDGVAPQMINQGNTQKFADLARVSLDRDGRAQVSIYRSTAIELPFRICSMERHPYGSQAFYPLHHRPFPIVVALPDSAPEADRIQAFLSNGRQGINIHPGVWHHYQLSLEQDSDYIVIDRAGPGSNCDEHQFDQEIILSQ
jgi:ureidoglycolate lyase